MVTVKSAGHMNLNGSPIDDMGAKEVNRVLDINSILSGVPYDLWVPLPASGLRPSARYKHAAEVAHQKLYVVGGSRNGRYLSDIQVFDLNTLTWSVMNPNRDSNSTKPVDNISNGVLPASAGHSLVRILMNPNRDSNSTKPVDNISDGVLPASAGHSLIRWGNKLLVVAGYSKELSDVVKVRSIDLETFSCNIEKTYGKIPIARGGQSVTLVGSQLIMFGGEDNSRRLLNDLHILDMDTMTWDVLEATQASPAPRFDHTATVHADQYLFIFGGCSHSTCFNDLYVLDLHTMDWSEAQVQGVSVTPRAGHTGTTIEENWYIAGGGDNITGASETIILDMPKQVWSVATNVRGRDPLSSEGLSLSSTTIDGGKLLVAFGGYNGKYHNEVFVLKPKPKDSIRPRIFQSHAAAAAAASVTAAYALTTVTESKKLDYTAKNENVQVVQAESSLQVVSVNTDKIATEKKMLESKLAEVRAENLRLKGNIDGMNSSHAELSLELQSVQAQREAERSRCLKLEVQVEEMRKRLESRPYLEHELDVLRDQKYATERDLAATGRQRSGGIWQWVGGNKQIEEQ